ncbi:MAG: hypothetical protein HY902_15220, partial [Deltaproteobacteria bacterium]|nr:hypothetical protein [Deltaproteobacteria bacterium]
MIHNRATWLTILAATLLIAAAYGPAALQAEYVHDDGAAITGNPLVAWPPDLAGIFSGRYFGPAERLGDFPSRPAVTLGFCLEVALGLASPLARHMVQLLLLLAVCVSGYLLLRDWLRAAGLRHPERSAGLAVALFAVHPLHTEAVMQVAYRPELQALWLLVLGTRELLQIRLGAPLRRHGPRLALWAALALLSKESSVAVLAWWGAWALLDKPCRQRLVPAVLATAPVALAWLAWRRWNIGSLLAAKVPLHDNPLAHVPTATRVISGLELSARALGRLVWPAELAPDYTFAVWPPAAQWSLLATAGALGLLALVAMAAWAWRPLARGGELDEAAQLRREGLVLWPLGLLLAWLPLSQILTPATVQFADRLLTTPSLWLAVAAALLSDRLSWRAVAGYAAVLLVPAVLQTRAVAQDWTAPLRLFERGVRLQPDSLRMRVNLAHLLVVQGRAAAALPHAQAALDLDRDDPGVWATGLDAALAAGNCPGAEPFVRALQSSTKRAVPARLASIGWGMRCQQYARAFQLVRAVPAGAWRGRTPLDAYVLAVAAQDRDRLAFARRFVADPDQDPQWVSATAAGLALGGLPD